MRILTIILCISFIFSGELEVEGNLNVTGNIDSPTIDALSEIVDIAVQRNTGARALRSVMERVMLNIMYELPSLKGIRSCKINRDVILKGKK